MYFELLFFKSDSLNKKFARFHQKKFWFININYSSMNIEIISIGKFNKSLQKEVFENYQKKLNWKLVLKEIEPKISKNFEINKKKELEADLILKNLNNNSKIISLDERGKQFSSKDFSKLIADFGIFGDSNLTFIIGGADGLSKIILDKSHLIISLSKMTFPHLVVRSILVEQIYRASSIISNHPYHRE